MGTATVPDDATAHTYLKAALTKKHRATINLYWTGRTYMSLPGKGLEGHICPTIMMPWWRHCDFI